MYRQAQALVFPVGLWGTRIMSYGGSEGRSLGRNEVRVTEIKRKKIRQLQSLRCRWHDVLLSCLVVRGLPVP